MIKKVLRRLSCALVLRRGNESFSGLRGRCGRRFLGAVFLGLGLLLGRADPASTRPNVILIMTDDQGYGDIGALGNSMIKTPQMDRLWAESVRLTNYHVDPTCSPTRSALMTGRYSTRTGVWHTIMGRSLLDPDELTLGELFAANGYRTGMFGKWHLGDNYPLRAEDQGFDVVVRNAGGGVGQGPDWWGNDYFDDTYWHNGKPERFSGYCTDVWFSEAIKFIKRNKDRPFFLYLSTNAAHGPYRVAERYSKPYETKGVPAPMSAFYGMITNLDENLGRLRETLKSLGLGRNTILIFTTDNGTSAGYATASSPSSQGRWRGFNAGMRGRKGSEYDGGHRVPFFVHWPEGKLDQGRDADQLCAHIDVLPTLVDLCRLKRPEGPPLDGVSLRDVLYGDSTVLRDRILFVHSQRIQYPQKWRKTSVMTDRWRLVNGVQLFDIGNDPGEIRDRSNQYPDVVARLRKAYEGWWEGLRPVFDGYVRIHLGSDHENPVRLMSHDWHCEKSSQCPWSQGQVRRGLIGNGPWAVYVERDGEYEIALHRWPRRLHRAMGCVRARVALGEAVHTQAILPSDAEAVFRLRLHKGPAMLTTWLKRVSGEEHGAYFAHVKRLR